MDPSLHAPLWISEHNIVFVICSMVKRKCVIYMPLASLNGIAKILILFSVGMKYVSVCVFLRGVKWTAGRYHARRFLTASLQWFLRASAARAASQTPAWPIPFGMTSPRPAWMNTESLASAAPLGPNTARSVPSASARYLTLT